jgi:hypothetical protein
MSSSAFLVIDQQPVSLNQALEYLRISGHLQPFLLEILYQHVLVQAVKSQVSILPTEMEQQLIEFRLNYQLADADEFQRWLIDRGTNYESFRQQFVWELAVETLKNQICQPQLQSVFLQCKSSFDQVVLSWIEVNTEAEAQSLYEQIAAGAEFEQLAIEHLRSAEIDISQGLQQLGALTALNEVLTYEELPEEFQEAIQEVQLGAVITLVIDYHWYLVRLEDWLPAELDDVKEHLTNEIFEQWLTEKVEAMTVQLSVN